MQWLGIDLTHLLNATIVLVTALITAAAVAIGRRAKEAPVAKESVSFEGAAIVSSRSVVDLGVEMSALRSAALEAAKLALDDADRTRKVGYKLIEMLERLEREMSELRKEISDLGKEVARAKH